MSVVDIQAVNAMDGDTFVNWFGDIYEHTPRVAEQAYLTKPFRDRQHLAEAMANVVNNFTFEEKVQLVLAHPRLGKRGNLTASSKNEQASIGLDKLVDKQADALAQLNDDYFERFQFPFIVAVKLLGGRDVQAVITERLGNEWEMEFATALGEIDKIAGVRLEAIVAES